MAIIYKITSPTGRIYVGKTINQKRRIWDYKWRSKRYETIIHNSIKKYGWEAHSFEVIEEIEEDKLNEREIFWINELQTYHYEYSNGMNMTKGGEGQRSTWMHDEERRKKQAQKFTKEGNPFYGKHHTEEFKIKKSKQVSEYNKKNGVAVPKWGAEKGRLKIIRQIICYNNNGSFVKEFGSLTDACIELEISISCIEDSLRYKSWVNGEYIFMDKTDNYSLRIKVGEIKTRTIKRPVICFINSFQIEYPSALEASKDLGIPKTTINRASYYNNLKPIHTGYVFIYKDLYEKIKQVS